MPLGIIMKGIVGFYYVKSGDAVYECKPRGIFRKDGLTPLPGDRVSITVTDEDKKTGCIDEIQSRDSWFIRPAVANVNQLAIIISLKSPVPDLMLLDKLLITCEMKGIKALICINKIDLADRTEAEKIVEAYKTTQYPLILISTVLGEGLPVLKEHLAGRITAFAGQSGVGKSTILNNIMNHWVMETGDVSKRIERGKHTTRHAELIELAAGGFVVDTPGFTSFELTDLLHHELEQFYPEYRDYLNCCRFTGCSHISEPECAVKNALQEGSVDRGRYDRYMVLYQELKQRKKVYR